MTDSTARRAAGPFRARHTATPGDRSRPRCWPSPVQELLLRAALLRGDDAIAAWKQWESCKPTGAPDSASRRIFPALYHNLRHCGVAQESLQSYRNAYDHAWCANQFMFAHAAALVRGLRSRSIDPLLLKGVALSLAFYPDSALRPMTDIDLLVRGEQIPGATESCVQLGWHPMFEPGDLLPLDQSVHFTRDFDFQLDLHWRVFWEVRRDNSEAPLWEKSIPFTVGGESARCLSAAHQLLHVCVHGTQHCLEPPIRWVSDAMAILHSPFSLDWDDFLEQTTRRRYTLHMRDTLEYLRTVFAAPIPPEILARLEATSVTVFDKLYYRTQSSRSELVRILLWWQLLAPVRHDRSLSWKQRISASLRYVRAKWRVSSLHRLPLLAMSKVGRKLLAVFPGLLPPRKQT